MAKTKNIAIKTNGKKIIPRSGAATRRALDEKHRQSSAVFSAGRAWCCLFFCEIESKKLRIVQGE